MHNFISYISFYIIIYNNSTCTSQCMHVENISPPEKVYITEVNLKLKLVTVNWSPVDSDCPALHYNILPSNCGSCPTTTTNITVTCTDVPTDGSVCTFAVQTVVCGNIFSNSSDQMQLMITAADSVTPKTVSCDYKGECI